MALQRVSAGMYKDSATGKTIKAASLAEAQKKIKAAPASTPNKVGISDFEKKQQERNSGKVSIGNPRDRGNSDKVSIENPKVPGRQPIGSRSGNDPASVEAQTKAIAGLYGNEAVNAGNSIINRYLPEGVLGQVDTTLQGGSEAIEQKRSLIGKYQQRDGMQTDVLNRMQSGLGGYTSPEYQAQREQMQRGIDSNYASSAGQLAKSQARAKVYGAAGTAQQANLQQSTQNSKNDLEQQLMVKNIDEKQRRLGEYGNYGRGLNQEEYGRQADASKGFADEASRQRQEQFDREKTNLGQRNAEVAARIGVVTGTGAEGISKAQQKVADRLQERAIAVSGRRR